ncbi:hypothetical protein Cyagr_0743 [Cyanobium gracile PCC 6307]|uniref:Uncharacterized protein n=1 Tax=Cyanobium gracile (strain ATCC 27147 / PCC 6307) TaxID=292564 RepID=K9P4B1_CYAGP|nr:hypothetical protein Cyagr_0743 [Cyanobium gracile PCC 6307]
MIAFRATVRGAQLNGLGLLLTPLVLLHRSVQGWPWPLSG